VLETIKTRMFFAYFIITHNYVYLQIVFILNESITTYPLYNYLSTIKHTIKLSLKETY